MIVLDGPIALVVVVLDLADDRWHVEVLEFGNRGVVGRPLHPHDWHGLMRGLAHAELHPEAYRLRGLAITRGRMLSGLASRQLMSAWPRARRRGAGSRLAQRPAGLGLEAVSRCSMLEQAP